MKPIEDYFEYCAKVNDLNVWGEAYEKGSPLVTDPVYDSEYLRLKIFEGDNPEMILAESPTQGTASGSSDGFPKFEHIVPMISIANSNGMDELLQWFDKKYNNGINDFILEYKLDGLALSLHYSEDGLLERAVTRGKNGTGDDVFFNACQVNGVIKELPKTSGIREIRGEVVWLISDFEEYQEKLINMGKEPLSNPRNGAAGALKQKDPMEVKERKLTFIAYSIARRDREVTTHRENLATLALLRFSISPQVQVNSRDALITACDEFKEERNDTGYLTDGLVLKVNDITLYDGLGGTSKTPHYLTALKFPPEEKSTKLLDIELSYGKSGAVTPVAYVEEVELSLTKVRRASLHNWDIVEYLGLYKGCEVIMRKAGEIIPEVVGVVGYSVTKDDYEQDVYHKNDVHKISQENKYAFQEKSSDLINWYEKPHTCGHCETTLERATNRQGTELVSWGCPNTNCSVKQSSKLVNFVSDKAMNMMGVGESLVESLVGNGTIKDVTDFYKLTKEDLLKLDSVKDRSAEKALAAINDSRKAYLNQVLVGLCITNLGRTASTKLADTLQTLEKFRDSDITELKGIEGIGNELAHNIDEFLRNDDNQVIIQYFIDNDIGTKAKENVIKNDKLKGKVVIMSGKSDSITRNEFKVKAIECGATISSSISKKVDFVVLGETGVGPSKMKKISELQSTGHSIQTMGVDEFINIIK
jgi:DNA ligase (NAD+)